MVARSGAVLWRALTMAVAPSSAGPSVDLAAEYELLYLDTSKVAVTSQSP